MVVMYEILLRLLYYTGIVLKKVVRNLVWYHTRVVQKMSNKRWVTTMTRPSEENFLY